MPHYIKNPLSLLTTFETLFYILLFLVIRLASFLLTDFPLFENIITLSALICFIIAYFHSRHLATIILIGELLLGGAGHFFELGGLSLRLLLLTTYLILWFGETIKNKRLPLLFAKFPRPLFYSFDIFLGFVLVAMLVGLVHDQPITHVIQDTIPFAYLLLVFPLTEFFEQKKISPEIIRLVFAFIIGSAIFSFITLLIFSFNIVELHEPFYNWFRDVAMGKITDMGTGFFRIVTPEHLLLTPLILFSASLLMRKEKVSFIIYHPIFCLLVSFSINFSRTYILGLIVGIFILLYKNNWRQWLKTSLTIGALGILIFISINIITSRGHSLGLELVGLQFGGIVAPKTEISTYTRQALLPAIGKTILEHPVLGSGLGSSITFFNPISDSTIKTRQYDWGYLELIAEFGLLGFFGFMTFIAMLGWFLIKKIQSITGEYTSYAVGLLSGLGAFVIMTVTAPALFHVFGMIFLVITMMYTTQPTSTWENIYNTIHRVWNKEH